MELVTIVTDRTSHNTTRREEQFAPQKLMFSFLSVLKNELGLLSFLFIAYERTQDFFKCCIIYYYMKFIHQKCTKQCYIIEKTTHLQTEGKR